MKKYEVIDCLIKCSHPNVYNVGLCDLLKGQIFVIGLGPFQLSARWYDYITIKSFIKPYPKGV